MYQSICNGVSLLSSTLCTLCTVRTFGPLFFPASLRVFLTFFWKIPSLDTEKTAVDAPGTATEGIELMDGPASGSGGVGSDADVWSSGCKEVVSV